MTATLTQRYLTVVARSIPPASRDDAQAELEASIADAVDARVQLGETPADAERAVLTELGDPAALAAGLSDRRLQLIGPRFFLTWWRLLKFLWAIIPPLAMAATALAQVLSDAPVDGIIGSAISVGIATFVHVGFWVTLVFAVLERTTGATPLVEWTPDLLPEVRTPAGSRVDLIASLVLLASGAAAILWDRFRGFVFIKSEPMSILHPDLWPWWITAFGILLVAECALVLAVFFLGRWNPVFASINSLFAIVFSVSAVGLLASGQLFNPEFVSAVFIDRGVSTDALRTLGILTGACLVGFPVWTIIDGWLKSWRDRK